MRHSRASKDRLEGEGDEAVITELDAVAAGRAVRGGRVASGGWASDRRATFYFGACAGGVWKTTDGGTYWDNVSDGFFKTAAVGAIAIADADPNVIYAGMGETCDPRQCLPRRRRLQVHRRRQDLDAYGAEGHARDWPRSVSTRANPDLVYVAALGHVWGPNEERGVFRSKRRRARRGRTCCSASDAGRDRSVDGPEQPAHPLRGDLAGTAQSRTSSLAADRTAASYRSTDGGDTWTEMTRKPGLPKGVMGRIGVAASPAQSRPGLGAGRGRGRRAVPLRRRRRDLGAVERTGDLRRRAWYYTHIFADPQDAETVWVLNLRCWKSIDGGKTFVAVADPARRQSGSVDRPA